MGRSDRGQDNERQRNKSFHRILHWCACAGILQSEPQPVNVQGFAHFLLQLVFHLWFSFCSFDLSLASPRNSTSLPVCVFTASIMLLYSCLSMRRTTLFGAFCS